jgi:hypothetical protein
MTHGSPSGDFGRPPVDERNIDWTRVGELLVISQLLSRENLSSAATLAMRMRMPLGRILSMHGYVNEQLIANAVELERLLSTNKLTPDAAIRALKAVEQGGENLQNVLLKPHANLSTNQPLGECLRNIGAVSAKQLRKAASQSLESGLPVGWVLASQGYITETLLSSAISAQRMIALGLLTEDQALNCLRIARLQQKEFRKVLSEQKMDTRALDPELLFVHLLVKSGVALKTEVLACREIAVLHNAELERYLYNFGILSEEAYTAVKAVVSNVTEGSLTPDQAVETLVKLKRVDWNMARIDATPASKVHVELPDLLGMTSLVSREQLNSLLERSAQSKEPLSKLLVDGGYVEQPGVDALERCKKFVNENLLHLHKALALIPFCADNQCTVEDALARFGWATIKA